ncbi:uncharacterized protein LOC132259985 isoform X2 [Phlebotomus argentipes]|uniref:uncharacterized protein LOC132259985 isoform X2 n=1 Tax=Phlebotomus argentipes TaxID=94469 RepID=UPI0028932434|nr:uncharacterized protein LOC132259985 isoform X2 [Phlebotomus argentipes]
MTMSQLLKRTKKCCMKLLRKLSVNDDESQESDGQKSRYGQPRTIGKYRLQKSRVDRCEMSPRSDYGAWSVASFDDDPSYENVAMAKYRNYRQNLAKCFRRDAVGKKNLTNRRHIWPTSSFNDDEEIVFTENRIYIGLSDRNLKPDEADVVDKVSKKTVEETICSNLEAKLEEKNQADNMTQNPGLIFEKVKYNKDKKYLQHSPSVHSNASTVSSTLGGHFPPMADNTSMSINFEQLSPRHERTDAQRRSEYDNWPDFPDDSGFGSETKCNFEWDASWGDDAKRPTPWDAEEADTKTLDSWDVLKSKVFDTSDTCWCSRRTSLCTVETWLEDEAFDNSFNEELERRCALQQR